MGQNTGGGVMGLFIWFFVYLIFYKVALEFGYYEGGSVLICIILSVTTVLVGTFANMFYAKKLSANPALGILPQGNQKNFLNKSIMTFFAVCVAQIIICTLIVFGFSEDLHRQVWHRRDPFADIDFWKFALIVCAPLFLDYMLLVIPTKLTNDMGDN
jgi:hypothetical protein